jgi:UDP-2,4-diacetamido-2,4,6-trideoxy-beta-L-altropyranose hydrolase
MDVQGAASARTRRKAIMNIAFRTDASLKIGSGHVMRCLTLADALKTIGASCRFICREHPGHLLDLIRQRGFEAIGLPSTILDGSKDGAVADDTKLAHAAWLGSDWRNDAVQTLSSLHGELTDWLVVDHYAIDSCWEGALRPACRKLMVIDDLADRAHDCDLLLDQNWFGDETEKRYSNWVTEDCRCLLGPEYALLKPEYDQLRVLMPPRDGIVRRVLVFLGGSDPTNQTKKVLDALMTGGLEHLAVDVVVGVNHPDPEGISLQVAARPATVLLQDLPSLAGLMARADLMIGAGGSTTWERMCLGLPTIVISIADNQTATNVALMKAGYIEFVGYMDDVSGETIADAVERCLTNPKILQKQSALGQSLVPGAGTALVCEHIFLDC